MVANSRNATRRHSSRNATLALVLVLIMVFPLAACGSSATATTVPAQPTTAPTKAPAPTLAPTTASSGATTAAPTTAPTAATGIPQADYYLLLPSTAAGAFAEGLDGLSDVAQILKVTTAVVGPAKFDAAAEAKMIDEIIAKKPAGLLILPGDATLKDGINKAIAAGIPVVTVGTDLLESNRYTFVGTDGYACGQLIGAAVATAVNKKGNVLVSLKAGQANLEDKVRGIKDYLAKNAVDVKVVDTVDDKGDAATGATAIAAAITKYPDLAGIAGTSEAGTAAAIQAVKQAGKTGTIKIVGTGRDATTLSAIQDGTVATSVSERSYLMSFLGVWLLNDFNHDRFKMLPDWRAAKVIPLPDSVDAGAVSITKANVAQFNRDPNRKFVTPTAADPNEEYYFLTLASAASYFIDGAAGVQDAGKALGVKGIFQGPADFDPPGLAQTLDAVVAKRPAGITILPADPTIIPGINRAMQAGIPVINIDADQPDSNRYTFIGTDSYGSGLLSGKLIAEAVGGKGKVVICLNVGQFNLEERARGVKEYLAKYAPDVQIVDMINDKADVGIGATASAAVLTRFPDLAGFVSTEAAGASGAARAVKEAGKVGKVKIVGMDRDDDTLNLIKEGTVYASVAQRSYLMSYFGVELLYMLKHNMLQMVPDWKAAGISPLPTTVNTGVVAITKDNVDQFRH